MGLDAALALVLAAYAAVAACLVLGLVAAVIVELVTAWTGRTDHDAEDDDVGGV